MIVEPFLYLYTSMFIMNLNLVKSLYYTFKIRFHFKINTDRNLNK